MICKELLLLCFSLMYPVLVKGKKKQYNRLCPGMSEASAVFLFYLFFAYFLFSFLLQGCRCLISFLMIVMAWVDADVRPEFHS